MSAVTWVFLCGNVFKKGVAGRESGESGHALVGLIPLLRQPESWCGICLLRWQHAS